MRKKIGITIIILTFILSLNLYWLIFTSPIFIIGTILVWTSELKRSLKLLWTILPVIMWYPTFIVTMYLTSTFGVSKAQKLDLIFPKDFKGNVIVINDITCGQEVKIVNGREQLFIPINGIFLYRGHIKNGYVNHKYFYKTKNEKLIEIPELANYMFFENQKNPPSTNEIGVWLIGTGSRVSLEPPPKIEYEYMTLKVSSKDSIDKYFDFQLEKRFEQTTDSLVRLCGQ